MMEITMTLEDGDSGQFIAVRYYPDRRDLNKVYTSNTYFSEESSEVVQSLEVAVNAVIQYAQHEERKKALNEQH